MTERLVYEWSRGRPWGIVRVDIFFSATEGWQYVTELFLEGLELSVYHSPLFESYTALCRRYHSTDYNPQVLPKPEDMAWVLLAE